MALRSTLGGREVLCEGIVSSAGVRFRHSLSKHALVNPIDRHSSASDIDR